jgi:hypothetical protein
LNQNLFNGSSHRRRDLGVDFVGRYFNQWFVNGNGVANLLQPTGYSAFGNAFAKRWKYY